MAQRARRLTGWDRSSQYILEGLLLTVMVLAVGLTVASLIDLLAQRHLVVPVELSAQALGSTPGASLVGTHGELTLSDPTTGQLILVAAPSVIGAAVVTGTAYSLYQVVRSLRVGTPFHRRNALRLIRAALIVLFGGAVTGLLDMLSTMVLGMRGQDLLGEASPILARGTLPLAFIGVGLVLLCLAEFFRRGTELSDDVAGLV